LGHDKKLTPNIFSSKIQHANDDILKMVKVKKVFNNFSFPTVPIKHSKFSWDYPIKNFIKPPANFQFSGSFQISDKSKIQSPVGKYTHSFVIVNEFQEREKRKNWLAYLWSSCQISSIRTKIHIQNSLQREWFTEK
jgi:hypothetical protein